MIAFNIIKCGKMRGNSIINIELVKYGNLYEVIIEISKIF